MTRPFSWELALSVRHPLLKALCNEAGEVVAHACRGIAASVVVPVATIVPIAARSAAPTILAGLLADVDYSLDQRRADMAQNMLRRHIANCRALLL